MNDILEPLVDIQGGTNMPGQDVLSYLAIMSFFVKIFEEGNLRQEKLLEIDEIVAKKTGINAMSVYRYSERDFNDLKK